MTTSAMVGVYDDAWSDLADELVRDLGFNRRCNDEERESLRNRLRVEQARS